MEDSPKVNVPGVTTDAFIGGTTPVPSEQLVAVDNTTIAGAGVGADPLHAIPGGIGVVADGVTIIGNGTTTEPLTAVGAAGSTIYFNAKVLGNAKGDAASAWTNDTTYTAGQQFLGQHARVYQCTTGGVSAASGVGPSGTGTGIVDGTAVWEFVRQATDDTAALNATATIAFNAGGGTVYTSNDWYLVSEVGSSFTCITQQNGVSWLGQSREGAGFVLSDIRASDSTPTRASVRMFSCTGANIADYTFESFTADGNRDNQTVPDTAHRDLIFLFNTERVVIYNVELRNTTGSGIAHTTGANDTKIDHCYIHDNFWMGVVWGSDGNSYRTLITHCQLLNNDNGFHVEASFAVGQLIVDASELNGNGSDLAMEIGGNASPQQAQNIALRNSYLTGGLLIENAASIDVTGNFISCNDPTLLDATVPLQANADVQDVYMAHNTVVLEEGGNAVAAVWLTTSTHATETFDNLVFHDNTVYVLTTTASGVLFQPQGTVRVERNKVIAIGAMAWAPNTAYGASLYTFGGTRVTNGGNTYQVVPGTSAASGGPTGTGSGIVDNTVIWNFASVGSSFPRWQPNTQYLPGTEVRNGPDQYICVAGTSAGSGGPTGTGASIDDGTVVWEYVGVTSTTQYGINLDTALAVNGIAAIIRGNYVQDFNVGIVTQTVGSVGHGGPALAYADISDNTFNAATAGVMQYGIGFEIDTRQCLTAAKAVGNKVINNAVPVIGTYPVCPLVIGGNDGDITFYSCTGTPGFAAPIGSIAYSRSGTAYINQTGLSGGWVALLTSVVGVGATVGQSPFSPNWQSGRFYAFPNYGSLNTNNNLGVGTMRVTPFPVPNQVTISELLFEVTAGGDATSVYRVVIYADDGTEHPGALVLDTGAVSVATGASGVPGVLSFAGLSTVLNPGQYHVGGVLQGTLTTQPTFRVIVGAGIMPGLDFLTSAPTAGGVSLGYNMAGVTGAAPATFVVSSVSSELPRVWGKIA